MDNMGVSTGIVEGVLVEGCQGEPLISVKRTQKNLIMNNLVGSSQLTCSLTTN